MFFILPIIFSTIGVAIFEFKIKAPWYIKLLFPFTYYILFQYSIVARSYCLVFPLLMIIACIYKKRMEKPILYGLVLFLFMNISAHTLVIAGSLYLLLLIDLFNSKKIKEKKAIIACILIFLELLITMLYAIPNENCSFTPKQPESMWYVISEATIGSGQNILAEILITFAVFTFIALLHKKYGLKSIVRLCIFILPVLAVFGIVTFQPWHVGIITISLFTYLIMEDLLNSEKLIRWMMLCVCIIQIYWAITSAYYDLNNLYSSSKEVADFLKDGYEDSVIYGLGYSTTAIEPYFEKNIFENRNTDKSFYIWDITHDYYTNKEMIENKADVYVVSTFYLWQYPDVVEALNNEGYERQYINGYTYIKDRIYEVEGYYIYTK